jgi:hypothetical protein
MWIVPFDIAEVVLEFFKDSINALSRIAGDCILALLMSIGHAAAWFRAQPEWFKVQCWLIFIFTSLSI